MLLFECSGLFSFFIWYSVLCLRMESGGYVDLMVRLLDYATLKLCDFRIMVMLPGNV